MNAPANRRVLLVDDLPSIHEDFGRILVGLPGAVDLSQDEAILFGAPKTQQAPRFELDSAYQGQEALAKVDDARNAGRPYAVAIVDMRMPPGWNGLETIERLWRADPKLQVVLCSAYSDITWEEVRERAGGSDKLTMLQKPFDPASAVALIDGLAGKWAQA